MGAKKKISGTDEAWENGELGRDEAYVARASVDDSAIDDAVELQMISIRLQKSLIDDFKLIAEIHGIGYQTLMRQILKRFADSEIKMLVRDCVLSKREQAEKERLAEEMAESKKRKAG